MTDPILQPAGRINTQVWNCQHAFSNLCPKRWSELTPTDQPGVRFCSVCSENVAYCTTPNEFVQLGNAGKCVAVPEQQTPDCLGQMLMGRPSVSAMKSFRDRQQQTANWWHDVIELEPKFGEEMLAEISQLSRMHVLGKQGLSDEHRQYLARAKEAIAEGPEALYRHLRTKPDGKPDNQQNIFRVLRSLFGLTHRQCQELAAKVNAADKR